MQTAIVEVENLQEGDTLAFTGHQVLDVTLTDSGEPSLLLERDDRCSVQVFEHGATVMVSR